MKHSDLRFPGTLWGLYEIHSMPLPDGISDVHMRKTARRQQVVPVQLAAHPAALYVLEEADVVGLMGNGLRELERLLWTTHAPCCH